MGTDMRASRWVGVLVGVVLCGACARTADEAPASAGASGAAESTSASATPVAGAPDACAWVTAEDLAAVLPDVAFDPPESTGLTGAPGMGSQSTCAYTRTHTLGDDASIAELRAAQQRATTITVIAWAWPDVAAAQGYVQSFVDAAPDAVERLDELGDEAIHVASGVSGVHWRRGTRSGSIAITARWIDPVAKRAAEIELARRAIARL
jgi:hypothetical protein